MDLTLCNASATPPVAIAIGGLVLVGTSLVLTLGQSEHHAGELGEGRRKLAERSCAMSSVDPATPQMDQCITTVLDECKGRSMSELPDCTLVAAQRRYSVAPY